MKILITGANGFLGRHVVEAALGKGIEVRALVRPVAKLPWGEDRPNIEVFRADLRSRRGLEGAFDGIDTLVHLAAGMGGDEFDQFLSSVVATENLLSAMGASECRRIVLVSSFSVYDYQRIRGPLTEDSPVLDAEHSLYERDGYAVAKSWQERVVRETCAKNDWDVCVLRPGFIFGPGNEEIVGVGFPVGPVFFRVLGGRRLPLTYVENTANAIVQAVVRSEASGQTINIVDSEGEGTYRYVREYYRWKGKSPVRVPLPYTLGYMNASVAHVLSRWIFRGKGKLPGILIPIRFAARFKPLRFDNERARRILGWTPVIGFDEAIQRTFHGANGASRR